MIVIPEKKDCSGCTACCSVCTHKAISMVPDSLGFLYPEVDLDKCTNCNLCVSVCPFKVDYKSDTNMEDQKAISYRLKDNNQLARSQSGGAFFSVAEKFLKRGGIIYGVSFNEKWEVLHKRVDKLNDLDTLRLSKYVQSNLNGIFHSVKDDLKNGINVLFSGTPCQVAGLKAFLPKKLQTNLYTIDLICHGVPSPKIWKDYLQLLQHKENSKLKRVRFRDKRFGWHGAVESFLFSDGKEIFRKTNNYLYFHKYSVRDSCSNCYFTNFRRVGDLTIGDFWGIPKQSEYNDEKGISQVLINNEKGRCLIDKILTEAYINPITLDQCLQPQLQHPIVLHKDRNYFIRDYQKYGFKYISKRYGDMGIRYKLKKVKSKLGELLRKSLSLWK